MDMVPDELLPSIQKPLDMHHMLETILTTSLENHDTNPNSNEHKLAAMVVDIAGNIL